MTPDTFQAFAAHAAGSPFEVCGLVLDGPERYFPCRNVAEGPDEFAIHPEDWAAAEDQGRILAICHSHPGATARPGAADVRGCEASGLPWLILGTDGIWRLDPAAYRARLEGRVFRWGWSDCYSLVRDFFGGLPDFPRTKADASRLYLEHYQRLGWHVVPREDMRPRDLILMAIQSHEPNHAAVYLGDGLILHHLANRLSMREFFGGSLQAATRLVLRRDPWPA